MSARVLQAPPGDNARYRPILRKDLDDIPQLRKLPAEERLALKAVSAVLPFRVNCYVIDELIDWDRIPEDPIYQLTFPQREMLQPDDFRAMRDLVKADASRQKLQAEARRIQMSMNPHPAGQLKLNVPKLGEDTLPGMQHKYRETVLFFPSQGQTCHAYCTYCFRWPQFVGIEELKFASKEAAKLGEYIRAHREVSDVLFTGGDPMVMKTDKLELYFDELLKPGTDHLTTIRIGTKALAYWPFRFTTDDDADDLLRLFERVQKAGKQVAIMAHFSHTREHQTRAVRQAVRRLKETGCVIRTQAPVIRHVNDRARTWADMWRIQVRMGMVPYYMFVERDTGPKNYFEVPLARAYDLFRRAYYRVSGLCRTVRGPSMSATPGKVVVQGVTEIHGEKVFVLSFLQGRNPEWVRRTFFAMFDPEATWLSDLKPALGEEKFFYRDEMDAIKAGTHRPAWDDLEPSAWRREDAPAHAARF
jgi:KamA family protein